MNKVQVVTQRPDSVAVRSQATIVVSGAPLATPDVAGLIRLAGELAGTADNPLLADPPIDLSVLFDNAIT